MCWNSCLPIFSHSGAKIQGLACTGPNIRVNAYKGGFGVNMVGYVVLYLDILIIWTTKCWEVP